MELIILVLGVAAMGCFYGAWRMQKDKINELKSLVQYYKEQSEHEREMKNSWGRAFFDLCDKSQSRDPKTGKFIKRRKLNDKF